jgi:hypothetical protein
VHSIVLLLQRRGIKDRMKPNFLMLHAMRKILKRTLCHRKIIFLPDSEKTIFKELFAVSNNCQRRCRMMTTNLIANHLERSYERPCLLQIATMLVFSGRLKLTSNACRRDSGGHGAMKSFVPTPNPLQFGNFAKAWMWVGSGLRRWNALAGICNSI